jgi:hypothetical protein
VLGVDRRRDRVHQGGEVRGAADRVELVPAAELVAQRHEVYRLALSVKREHRLIDGGVLRAVEIDRPQEVADLEDGVGVDEDRAEDALLGLDRLRCQLVDAHATPEATEAGGPGRPPPRRASGKSRPVCG